MSKVTFIAPAFNEQKWNRPLLDSLMMQGNPNWECIVYHNGINKEMRDWAVNYNDKRIQYIQSEENTGCWGTYNRIKALNHIETEYVIQTSVQDYYLSWAVELILQKLEESNTDICIWDSINHLSGHERLDVKLEKDNIDWGNFALRTDIAKKISIPKPEEFCADWYTIEKGLTEGYIKNHSKVFNILTIHN